MAIWSGNWNDAEARPFDPNASGPRNCNPHAPTHVIRRGARRSPGQRLAPFAARRLARNFWDLMSPAQRANYDTPIGGFGPGDRGAQLLSQGGWSFFLNANIQTILNEDYFYWDTTTHQPLPVSQFSLSNHNRPAQTVDLDFNWSPANPPGIQLYADLHIAQIAPTKYQTCKTWYYTKVIHTEHLTGYAAPPGPLPYTINLTYPWTLNPDYPLQIYVRARGPNIMASQDVVGALPLSIA